MASSRACHGSLRPAGALQHVVHDQPRDAALVAVRIEPVGRRIAGPDDDVHVAFSKLAKLLVGRHVAHARRRDRRAASCAARRTPRRAARPPAPACEPAEGNAIAIATDMTIGKRNDQKSASGSRTNSRRRASVSSIERMMRSAARCRYSSRRCRPVSDMKTSSSVPSWTTTFGAPSAATSAFGASSAMILP